MQFNLVSPRLKVKFCRVVVDQHCCMGLSDASQECTCSADEVLRDEDAKMNVWTYSESYDKEQSYLGQGGSDIRDRQDEDF